MFKNFSMVLGGLSFFFFVSGVNFVKDNSIYMIEYYFVSLNSIDLQLCLYFDWMSLFFMSFVCFISSMVLFYSRGYMNAEENKGRFCLLVVLFVLSMMMMIVSSNLVFILLGWDGLGLISYCLVIYYQNIKSFNAGMLTALTNRIGDVALLMSIAWFLNFGSWNFLLYLDMMKNDCIIQFVGYFIMLAAWTKSAQIPFSSWLPAAMAAPTPVSSLVHSSTLVTAGVYLLIRFNMMFSVEMKFIMLFLSLFTMFMSGMGANFEFDLKKIIALSTLSQLGLMMSILALGEFKLAFFHLLIHAIFKALLFMCAGNLIHNFSNCQDIRYMGNLVNIMPLTSSFFNVSNLSLCGLPFFSGFYSKDLILEIMSMNYLNLFVYFIFYLSVGLTVMYSVRLSFYSLFSSFNFLSLNCLNDENKEMLLGMSGLIMLVIFMGSVMMWMIFPEPYFICLPFYMKFMTLLMVILGGYLGYELFQFNMSFEIKMQKYYKFSLFNSLMWNMPILSTLGVNFYMIFMGNYFMKVMDQGWSEILGAQQLKLNFVKLSTLIQFFSVNHIKVFFILMLIWLMFILVIF